MTHQTRYLKRRGRMFHYLRRVPTRFRALDPRGTIQRTLRTASSLVAEERRDLLEAADHDYWAGLAGLALLEDDPDAQARLRAALETRYHAACLQAVAKGRGQTAVETVLRDLALGTLLDRLEARGTAPGPATATAMAVRTAPPAPLSAAFELYCERIAAGDLILKSPAQRREWQRGKARSVNNFIQVVADKPIGEITREDALKFYAWWAQRFKPKAGATAPSGSAANRDLGTLRRLYAEYFAYFGEERAVNPFHRLAFKAVSLGRIPAFEDAWVRERILVPGALDALNDQARYLLLTLIETGCRPSEVAALTRDDIVLDGAAPFIRIQPRHGREIKTLASIRDIPLVGVAEEAMRRAPQGFPRYRDRGNRLSRDLMAGLRDGGLLPSERHRVTSFRHAFEQRMLEAGIDFGLRCRLMGHAINRPAYGDGGSIAFRRRELLKIVHPFPEALFGRGK